MLLWDTQRKTRNLNSRVSFSGSSKRNPSLSLEKEQPTGKMEVAHPRLLLWINQSSHAGKNAKYLSPFAETQRV